MNLDILLTLKLNEDIYAQPKHIALLEYIIQTGSISQAAKLNKMSYKTAWDAIDKMNQMSPIPVVDKSTGGKGGGGADVTRYGKRLIQLYQLLAQIQSKALTVLQDESLPLDSLLAAIARFSLQTSARNQIFAIIEQVKLEKNQAILSLKLHDNITNLTVAITRKSAERLQLTKGSEVIALIKAPSVKVMYHTKMQYHYDQAGNKANFFSGIVAQMSVDEQYADLQITLSSGLIFSVLTDADVLLEHHIEVGHELSFYISPDDILIATLC